jgi:WD40 repeat protein
VAFSPDGRMLAVLHTSTEVRLLDPATCREFARLPSLGSPLCFSRDGGTLVTDAGSGTLQIWDLKRIREQLAAMGLDWE